MKISKVVDAASLELATRDGWALVFTGSQHERIEVNRRQPTQDERNRGAWQDVVEYAVGPRLTFVVEKDAEVQSREDVAQSNAMNADRQRREAEQALEKLKAQYGKLETEIERVTERERAAVRRCDDAVTRCRKLEVDIGKIRQALGDLRMKEILG